MNNSETYDHFDKLIDLGYLPLEIKALPEGSFCPIGVPFLTIKNTHPDFYWLTNYIETVLSVYMWKSITVATLAFQFRKLFEKYALLTNPENLEFTKFQGHDFSFRGLSSLQDAAITGSAHLTSFDGTDTVISKQLLSDFYNCTFDQTGFSVPATEHSVMSAGGDGNEFETYKRLITEIYPHGIVSIVSDTWDFWRVITEYLPRLKNDILNRDGKVVIRPDSGNPCDILCGSYYQDSVSVSEVEKKGLIEVLYDIFGGTISSAGYKVLNPKIGVIYGDSINLLEASHILDRLRQKGFASTNIVFGIGSFSYQHITRDSLGMAIKATSAVINGERVSLFKNPKTDNGLKKSLRGLLKVERCWDSYKVIENVSEEEEKMGELVTVFKDGEIVRHESFSAIKHRIKDRLKYLKDTNKIFL